MGLFNKPDREENVNINIPSVSKMVDIHSHILPGMDDGCKTVEETAEALKMMKAQGINYVIATPHFLSEEDPDSFLKRRNEAVQKIQELKGLDIPEVYIGAEVAYFDCIGRCESMTKLAISGTRYILIEMPYGKWSEHVINEINMLSQNYSLIPIVAHIERYIWKQSRKIIEALFDSELLIQANADGFVNKKEANKNFRLLEAGSVDFLGSDTHNLSTRKPNLLEGIKAIDARGYREAVDFFADRSNYIIQNAERIL